MLSTITDKNELWYYLKIFMNKAVTPDGIEVWYERLSDESIEISFSTDVLIDSYRKGFSLYIPVDERDNTRVDLCYWRDSPRKSLDIKLCDVLAFCDPHEESFEEYGTGARFPYSNIPKTGIEYQKFRQDKAFCEHVNGLIKNGCNLTEAYTIATSHATGLPVSNLDLSNF